MLTKLIVSRLPSEIVRRTREYMGKLSEQEIDAKSALESALRKVNHHPDIFNPLLEAAEGKIRVYRGELKGEFTSYLNSIKKVREEKKREVLGYGATYSG